MPRPLSPGIYAPLVAFFDNNEELDIASYKQHVKLVGKAGISPVISGSNGESVHLSHSERSALIKAARSALDEVGLTTTPIVAGTGAFSTKETIQLTKEAAEAGADATLVISPGYYSGYLAQNDYEAIKQFFIDVAAASPIPVLLYNFPAVTSGLDLDADVITEIAKRAPNTAGVKLTCNSVGKLARIARSVNASDFRPAAGSLPFLLLNGFTDTLLPSVVSGGSGAITGVANVAPYVCVHLWKLATTAPTSEEAQELQWLVARADYAIANSNVPGTKYILSKLFGYNAKPRRPMLPYPTEKGEALLQLPEVAEILQLEKKLSDAGN